MTSTSDNTSRPLQETAVALWVEFQQVVVPRCRKTVNLGPVFMNKHLILPIITLFSFMTLPVGAFYRNLFLISLAHLLKTNPSAVES